MKFEDTYETMENKWITRIRNKPIPYAVAGVGIVLALFIGYLWITAGSGSGSTKGDNFNTQSDGANANSIRAETDANTAGTKANALDVQRVDAINEYNGSRQALNEGRKQNEQKLDAYEKARRNRSATNSADLDNRERDVRTRLTDLYSNSNQ